MLYRSCKRLLDIVGAVITAGQNVHAVLSNGSDIINTVVTAGGHLHEFQASGDIIGSTVSARTMWAIWAAGNVTDSVFAAGFNPLTGTLFASGWIHAFHVGGNFKNSDVSAGVSWGADGEFGTGDDVGFGGTSTIGMALVDGDILTSDDGNNHGIVADRGPFTVTDGSDSLVATGAPQIFPGSDVVVRVL